MERLLGLVKASLLAIAAEKRYRVEVGGKTIMGAPFRTDRESQGLISGAAALTKITGQSIKWKTPSGFIEATASQIEQVAIAVGNHVQACFAAEDQIIGPIQNGTITTVTRWKPGTAGRTRGQGHGRRNRRTEPSYRSASGGARSAAT